MLPVEQCLRNVHECSVNISHFCPLSSFHDSMPPLTGVSHRDILHFEAAIIVQQDASASTLGLRQAMWVQYFEAATIAQQDHAASWHGWGLLERRAGNQHRARDIWLQVNLLLPRIRSPPTDPLQ